MAKFKVTENNVFVPTDNFTETTVGHAREVSREIGARVFWRPDGSVNRNDPDKDTAIIVTQIEN